MLSKFILFRLQTHVAGHKGIIGNVHADSLAKKGAAGLNWSNVIKSVRKSVTKAPPQPGIKQTDLEAIKWVPCRETTEVKTKTPPPSHPSRSGISNLPSPPGEFS